MAATIGTMANKTNFPADATSDQGPLARTLRPVFKKFLESLSYTPTPRKAKSALHTGMHLQAISSGVPYEGNAHSRESFDGAVAVAEVRYLVNQEPTLCWPRSAQTNVLHLSHRQHYDI